jgi:cation diffusion facilitator CzcD-associated flavoprotein CzcO
VADKYQTRKYVKFNHMVTGARWDEDKGTWGLTIHDKVNNRVRYPPICSLVLCEMEVLICTDLP